MHGIQIVDLIIAALLFLGFLYFCLGLAASMGIHAGDDAFCATAAKNLAMGAGYSIPGPILGYDVQDALFDPWISQGPAVVFPVALAIKVFGPTDVVPSLAATVLWAILLLGFFFILCRQPRQGLFTPAVFTIVLATLGMFGHLFEQWVTMLGEVHAGLFAVLAIAYLVTKAPNYRNSFIAGMLFGLAVASKFLVILAVPGLFLASLLMLPPEERRVKKIAGSWLALSVGIALPHLLFEGWKLWMLGWGGFADNFDSFLNFLKNQGVGENRGIGQKLVFGFSTLEKSYFLSWVDVLMLALLTSWLAIRVRKNRMVKAIYWSALAAAGVMFAYWLLFSKGWARYAVVPFVIYICALAATYLELRWKETVATLVVLAAVFMGGLPRMNYALSLSNHRLFHPSDERMERFELMKRIHDRALPTQTVLVTSWWATGMDIQYCLPKGKYIYLEDKCVNKYVPAHLIVNRRFQDKQKMYPEEGLIFDGEYYRVLELPAKGNRQ